MKKVLCIFSLLCMVCTGAWAQTVIARMPDLVGAGTNNGAVVSADWKASEGDVYEFSNNHYIGGIVNDAVAAAIEGNQYVTIAMYVYGTGSSGCPFGYGDQGDGLKYKLSGTTAQVTTKGVADLNSQALGSMGDGWNLVAFTVPGKANTSATQFRYICPTGFYTKDQTLNTAGSGQPGMINPSNKKFAIGSGNQGNAREAFTGMIANVTVITSSGLLSKDQVLANMAAAPQKTAFMISKLEECSADLYGNIVKRAVDPATTIEEGWYVLNNVGRSNCVKDNGSAFKMATLISGYTGVTEHTLGYMFHITRSETEGKWNIVSGLGHGISLAWNSSSQISEKHDFTIELIEGQTNVFCIKDDATGYYADGQATNNNFVGWGTSAPSSATGNDAYKLYKIEEGVVCATDLGHLKDAKWYQLNVRNKYVKYNAADKTYSDELNDADATDNTRWFAFVGDNSDGYKIINYAAGADVAMGAANITTDTRLKAVPFDESHTYIFEGVTYNNAPALQIYEKRNNKAFLNQQGTNLGYWTPSDRKLGDEGNVFVFTEVGNVRYNCVAFDCTATKNGEDAITWKQGAKFVAENEAAASMVTGGEFITNITITDDDKTLGKGKYVFAVTADHSYPFAEGKFYLLKNRYDNNHVAVDNNEKTYARSTRNMDKANYLWSFERVENTPDQFYVKNLALDKYLTGTSGVVSYNASKTNAYTIWKDTQMNTANGFCLHVSSSTSTDDVCVGSHAAGSNLDSSFPNAVHNDGNASLSVWSRGRDGGARKDNGSVFWVEEFDEDILNVSNSLGEGYVGSMSNFGDFETAKTSYKNAKTAANLRAALEAYAALGERKELTANRFYYIRHKGSIGTETSHYPYTWLTSDLSTTPVGGENHMILSHEETPDASCIFYYNGSQLIAYKNGLFAHGNSTSMEEYTWNVTPQSDCAYCLKNGDSSLTYWGHDGSAGTAAQNYTFMNNGTGDWAAWYFKEVTELPVSLSTIGDHCYGTLYTPVALDLSEGWGLVKAYAVVVNGDKATMESVGNVIPANSAVVLYSKLSGMNTANLSVGGEANYTGDNALEGQVQTKSVEASTVLTMQNGSTGIGFYNYKGTNLKGFKAYLPKENAQGVQSFTFNFDDIVTGIQQLEDAKQTVQTFDLSGRQVGKTQRGLYISNGRKVVR